MKNLLISIALSLGFGTTAFSMSYDCKQAGAPARKLEVKYHSDKKVPCEVVQTRGTVAKKEWGAEHEEGYCEKKAEEELARLKAQGWQCESSELAPASKTTEAAPVAPAAPAAEVKEEAAPAKAETTPAKPETVPSH